MTRPSICVHLIFFFHFESQKWFLVIAQVKSSLFSSDGRIVEKNDDTPVTVADFGVQALVSLGDSLNLLYF